MKTCAIVSCMAAVAFCASPAEILFTDGPQEYGGRKYYWLAEWKLEVTLPDDVKPDDRFEVPERGHAVDRAHQPGPPGAQISRLGKQMAHGAAVAVALGPVTRTAMEGVQVGGAGRGASRPVFPGTPAGGPSTRGTRYHRRAALTIEDRGGPGE